MAAGGFLIDRIETVLLQHRDGAARAFNDEVIDAGAEPDQLQPFLQFGIIEGLPMLLLESWARRRVGATASEITEQTGTEDTDIGEVLEVRYGDIQGLA